jgi:hypothetical protein
MICDSSITGQLQILRARGRYYQSQWIAIDQPIAPNIASDSTVSVVQLIKHVMSTSGALVPVGRSTHGYDVTRDSDLISYTGLSGTRIPKTGLTGTIHLSDDTMTISLQPLTWSDITIRGQIQTSS